MAIFCLDLFSFDKEMASQVFMERDIELDGHGDSQMSANMIGFFLCGIREEAKSIASCSLGRLCKYPE